MKIICVGMNYAEHNKELNHSIGEVSGIKGNPTLFLKPDTAIGKEGWPFFVPEFSNEVEYETEVVVRISRLGRCIPTRFAHRYYNEISLGIDFTARDIQRELKSKGLPWEISKGFDGSAAVGKFVKLEELGIATEAHPEGKSIQDLHFEMKLNDEVRQIGHTADMLHTIDEIISYASQFYMLKIGDLIFTGTPKGVGKVKEGDIITATLEGRELLNCKIK